MYLQGCVSILSLCAVASASVLNYGSHVKSNTGKSSLPRTAAYYANWDIYSAEYYVTDIPASQLTHLIYAFANINSTTGEVYLSDDYADLEYLYPGDDASVPGPNVYGNIKQLFLLKKKHRNLKTMISIGGGTYSANLVPVLASETLRQSFANSAVKLVSNLGFDGIDIDYESVSSTTQAEQFVDLLNKTRSALDTVAANISTTPFLLSFASPAGSQNYDLLDFPSMDKFLDFWNYMGYAYAGSWNTYTGHDANLFYSSKNPRSTPVNTNSSITDYIAKGATPSKINLGSPLYGISFNNTAGPGTPFDGIGDLGTLGEAGTWNDNSLPVPGFNATTFELPEIGASYSYDPVKKYMISYDTPKIAAVKAEYVTEMGLGGTMWWEVSMDKNGTSSLINATVRQYGGESALDQTLNNLNYPTSIYDNLRAGFPENSTTPAPTSTTSSAVSWTSTVAPSRVEPSTTASCTEYHLVVSGDTCYKIWTEYGITAAEFAAMNPYVGSDCANLWLGFYVCVEATSS
ncbi:Endochitinase B1 [Talaromyces atroroseus]|uniref:chitinase n=1 Tax=Talaromyces atroroseus TaxID=1441469 RepID=A0A225AJD4_TALAT|nr:Endochitinase B1 [Talaromyces atroroseus]OKL60970.1 Endochitinase B1 [Talaromyces atroroseus]